MRLILSFMSFSFWVLFFLAVCGGLVFLCIWLIKYLGQTNNSEHNAMPKADISNENKSQIISCETTTSEEEKEMILKEIVERIATQNDRIQIEKTNINYREFRHVLPQRDNLPQGVSIYQIESELKNDEKLLRRLKKGYRANDKVNQYYNIIQQQIEEEKDTIKRKRKDAEQDVNQLWYENETRKENLRDMERELQTDEIYFSQLKNLYRNDKDLKQKIEIFRKRIIDERKTIRNVRLIVKEKAAIVNNIARENKRDEQRIIKWEQNRIKADAVVKRYENGKMYGYYD